MYLKIVEDFGPASGRPWQEYLEWRKARFLRFDSVDGSLRPDLFCPESQDDWNNCVNEDFKINLIASLDYARKVIMHKRNARIVGVDVDLGEAPLENVGLLGFDILDQYGAISLLTNWRVDDPGFIDRHLENNGLISEFSTALRLRDCLRDRFRQDGHANSCVIWGIYEITT